MAKVSPEFEQAFKPVRRNLKRIIVEAKNPKSREIALSYRDATDDLIKMSGPGGTLKPAVQKILVDRLKTHAVTIAGHVVRKNWPLALETVHLLLAPPPGETTTFPDVPPPPPKPRKKAAPTKTALRRAK